MASLELPHQLAAAVALRESGATAAANQALVELAAQYPDHATVQYQCAWSFDVLGLESQAVPYYQRALAGTLTAPDRHGAFIGLGSTLRTLGRYAESATVFENALVEFPDNAALRAFYAMTLHNLGRHAQAIQLLLHTLADTSADAEVMQYCKALHFFYAPQLDRIWS